MNFVILVKRRELDIVVISDTHLGTIGSQSKELHKYLKSIDPKKIILNGDIIDVWQFSKRKWDKYHTKIIGQLLKFISKGVEVHYIVGNHDESFRRFLNLELDGFKISNKLKLDLDGQKAWFFHGDVFDVTMQHSRWITRLGGYSYDALIFLNSTMNRILTLLGRDKISFSKTVKNKVKAAVSYINKFEVTVAEIAIHNNYDYVVCGHIHQPCIKTITTKKGSVQYLNSGDWIENLTALEYKNKAWTIFQYDTSGLERVGGIVSYDITDPTNPTYANYITTRDFGGNPEEGTSGDLAPEGLAFIPSIQSPNNKALLVVTFEVSGSVSIFELGQPAVNVEESTQESIALQVYPNPSNTDVTFRLNNTEVTELTIYNPMGSIIHNHQFNGSTTLGQDILNTAGVHFYQLSNQGKVTTGKFIITK